MEFATTLLQILVVFSYVAILIDAMLVKRRQRRKDLAARSCFRFVRDMAELGNESAGRTIMLDPENTLLLLRDRARRIVAEEGKNATRTP